MVKALVKGFYLKKILEAIKKTTYVMFLASPGSLHMTSVLPDSSTATVSLVCDIECKTKEMIPVKLELLLAALNSHKTQLTEEKCILTLETKDNNLLLIVNDVVKSVPVEKYSPDMFQTSHVDQSKPISPDNSHWLKMPFSEFLRITRELTAISHLLTITFREGEVELSSRDRMVYGQGVIKACSGPENNQVYLHPDLKSPLSQLVSSQPFIIWSKLVSGVFSPGRLQLCVRPDHPPLMIVNTEKCGELRYYLHYKDD